MREATIKAFTFDELSDKAKDKARQWVIEGNWNFLPEQISELFEQELTERGLGSLKASWSLGYSQGDGVAFEGSIDLSEIKPIQGDGEESDKAHISAIHSTIADGAIPSDYGVTVYSISNHYSHWNTFRVEVEDQREIEEEWSEELQREIDRQTNALEESILSWLQDLSRYLEKLGYSEIEYQESDETIQEACEANEWIFSESGQYIGHLIDNDR